MAGLLGKPIGIFATVVYQPRFRGLCVACCGQRVFILPRCLSSSNTAAAAAALRLPPPPSMPSSPVSNSWSPAEFVAAVVQWRRISPVRPLSLFLFPSPSLSPSLPLLSSGSWAIQRTGKQERRDKCERQQARS
ncbi:hypothetical protein LZ31DRAFT_345382 [Colletotrichum somersetense]|nr:hypothetical protein LZ31DRAFT_345382 [Colletotrichum somersetense]